MTAASSTNTNTHTQQDVTPAPPAAAAATATATADPSVVYPGLTDVTFSSTRLSRVDGERGELTLAGYSIEDIAPQATFEEAAYLLMHGALPSENELAALKRRIASYRRLPAASFAVLEEAAKDGLSPMGALPLAASTLAVSTRTVSTLPISTRTASTRTASKPSSEDLEPNVDLPFSEQELIVLARLPRLVAAYARLLAGKAPVEQISDGGIAEDFLFALHGHKPAASAVRALDTYLVTVCDHGANASTFAARVIISTGAGTLESILGALGALSGPLHGGAPGPALDLVKAIGSPERAEAVLRQKLDRGERLMGFGHRVYKVRDPRAEVLSQAAKKLYEDPESGADASLYSLTRHVEQVAVHLLDEYKPGRRLRANVELYTALLLDGIGLDSSLFTPVFAIARTAGWLAHGREQREDGKLIRPRLRYDGAERLRWRR